MANAASSTAPGWEKWADWMAVQQKAVIDWLCRSAGLAPGMTVLDVASGVGQPALQAAAAVLPNGRVIASDVAVDMLAGCERRAQAAGVSNITLRELDMHDLSSIAEASVDAVTFGFALMFSPEPVKVMKEIRRVLVPGGRVALCVWAEPAQNPFFTTMFGAVAEVAPPPEPPSPRAPGPFRLASRDELAEVLRDAGFHDVSIEAVPFDFEFASIDQHWEINRDMAAPLKRLAATLPADRLARLRSTLAASLTPYVQDGRVRIRATASCASARK